MRSVLAACGFLSPLLASCGKDAAPDRSSPEGMARVAFRALRDGDLKSLRGTLITAGQMRAVVERQGATATPEDRVRAEERVARRGGFDAMAQKEAEGAMKRFAAAREAAAKDFDWAGAEFAGLAPFAKERAEGGLRFARVVFRVSAGGKTYELASNDATCLDGGKRRFLVRSAGPDRSRGTPDDVTVESGSR